MRASIFTFAALSVVGALAGAASDSNLQKRFGEVPLAGTHGVAATAPQGSIGGVPAGPANIPPAGALALRVGGFGTVRRGLRRRSLGKRNGNFPISGGSSGSSVHTPEEFHFSPGEFITPPPGGGAVNPNPAGAVHPNFGAAGAPNPFAQGFQNAAVHLPQVQQAPHVPVSPLGSSSSAWGLSPTHFSPDPRLGGVSSTPGSGSLASFRTTPGSGSSLNSVFHHKRALARDVERRQNKISRRTAARESRA